jgi:putative hydrolase of HD superfamily
MLETMPATSLQNLIKFLEITGILKQTERTGWIEVGVYQPESVADHTFRTAILCMLYADIEDLDPLKLVRMALIHDLPEAVIGDLTPSQKTAESKEKEETAISQILSLLPKKQMKTYLAVWKEYQEGKTREAKAVRQLEKIEMALQAKEYQKWGSASKSLERFIKSAEEATALPELKRLLSCVLEER